MKNEADGGKWLRTPNTSSIENCFNYTFPHEDENSVLLQQGAVATLDTRNYSLVRHNQYLDYQTYTLYSADPSNNISIQIPVLFDVSGSALLYGEEYEDDMIDAHLQFTLDMRTDTTNSFKVDDLTDVSVLVTKMLADITCFMSIIMSIPLVIKLIFR